MIEFEEYASPACRLHEADPAYVDPKLSDAMIRADLVVLRRVVEPPRQDVIAGLDDLIDRLADPAREQLCSTAYGAPLTLFDRLLPRIADPVLHRDLMALRALYVRGGSDAAGT